MFHVLGVLIVFCSQFFRSRRDLLLENVALRQQLSIIIRKQTRRRLTLPDKLFWISLSRFWLDRSGLFSSFNPKRLSVGIAPDSSCTGNGSPANEAVSVGSRRARNCVS
jgi:hypothetical protein